jgi:Lrp/AsnC family transcriptional regulator for asnA, asnC and gidA
MDSLDQELIDLLQQDASRSSIELAKQLHVSSVTIRRRLKKLTQSGVLRIVGWVNYDKIGLPLFALIALHVVAEKIDSVMHLLNKRPEVTWVATTTGRFDLILVAHFRATGELSAFVHKELPRLEGFKDSETFICLNSLSFRDSEALSLPY